MWQRSVLCAVLGCVLAAARANADPITVTGGVTLNLLDGYHATGTELDRLDFVPLPLAEIDARHGRTSLHLETFPAVTFAYGSAGGTRQSTRLGIINLTVRRALPGGVFAGAGQTIYNQLTTYPASIVDPVTAQSSRVTGVRLEAGIVRTTVAGSRIEYVVAINPVMHGIERSAYLARLRLPESAAPERAAQIDTSLRCVTPLLRGSLVYGIRYLNYASRYALHGRANGMLADRNTGLLPLIGYQVAF